MITDFDMETGKKLIALTGGIGSGKSVVSRVLRCKGYAVYDCDTEAKRLMAESAAMLSAMRERFGEACITEEGAIDRRVIAERIFNDSVEREWLNAMVHAEVRIDLGAWLQRQADDLCFVESAIPVTSGLDVMCDAIWFVVAPEEVRIERALARGGIDRTNLMRRIEAQRAEFESLPETKTSRLRNGENASLLSQIEELIKRVIT